MKNELTLKHQKLNLEVLNSILKFIDFELQGGQDVFRVKVSFLEGEGQAFDSLDDIPKYIESFMLYQLKEFDQIQIRSWINWEKQYPEFDNKWASFFTCSLQFIDTSSRFWLESLTKIEGGAYEWDFNQLLDSEDILNLVQATRLIKIEQQKIDSSGI